MIKEPAVGMVVRLNNTGLDCIFRSNVGLAHMKSLEMKISAVYHELYCDDGHKVYDIDVDNLDISQFMLSSELFDEVVV